MRERLSELGLPVPDWARVETPADLDDFIADHGGAAVVKTPRGGYDGKGVRVVRTAAEVAEWFATIAEDGRGGALLVEELVDFRRELAQLVARRPSGEIAAWPVVETVQLGGVCSEVIAPAPHSAGRLADVAADVADLDRRGPRRHGRARRRAVRDDRRPDPRQRARHAPAQQRPLVDGRVDDRPVRAAPARGARPAARRHRQPRGRGPSWSTCSAAPRRAP